jgi:hypothetical protein
MRKEYRQALRAELLQLMSTKLPAFGMVKGWIPGEIPFEKQAPDNVTRVYITIVPDVRGGERFTVELGWSTKGRFPDPGSRPSGFPTSERLEFSRDEFICRLEEILRGKDEWWVIEKPDAFKSMMNVGKKLSSAEATKRIKPFIDDAVEKIVGYGVSYLNEYLENKFSNR